MKPISILPALPTVSSIVLVTLSADLAASINRKHFAERNQHNEGEVYPLIVSRVWSGTDLVNGQLILDGVGTLWMTSVRHGDEPGCWHWPHIEFSAELKSCVQDTESSDLDLCDLLHDELTRIKAMLAGNNDPQSKEIVSICERSSHITRQRVPIIDRCDKLEAENAKLKIQLSELASAGLSFDHVVKESREWREETLASRKLLGEQSAKIESLEEQLGRVRLHETHLIQDRDTRIAAHLNELKLLEEKNAQLAAREADVFQALLKKDAELDNAKNLLAKVRAVDGAWMAVFDELRKTGN